jgi:hypothetical protein
MEASCEVRLLPSVGSHALDLLHRIDARCFGTRDVRAADLTRLRLPCAHGNFHFAGRVE